MQNYFSELRHYKITTSNPHFKYYFVVAEVDISEKALLVPYRKRGPIRNVHAFEICYHKYIPSFITKMAIIVMMTNNRLSVNVS